MGEHREEEMVKRAIVTGGSTGIGAAIVRTLAQAGWDVGISVARDVGKAQQICDEVKAMGRHAWYEVMDLTEDDSVPRFFKRAKTEFASIDLLVNNAGVTVKAPFLECDAATIDFLYRVDYRGAFLVMQQAARWMIATETPGSMILISSNNSIANFAKVPVYGSMKSGVEKLIRHIALEVAKHKIRVNSIAPGWTDTGSSRLDDKESTYYKIPLKRWVEPGEIGEAILFLTSPAAASITGTTLVMDGGACLLNDHLDRY